MCYLREAWHLSFGYTLRQQTLSLGSSLAVASPPLRGPYVARGLVQQYLCSIYCQSGEGHSRFYHAVEVCITNLSHQTPP